VIWCADVQAQTGKDTTASLQAQLGSATCNAEELQQAINALTDQLTSATADVARLNGQVATLQLRAEQERQSLVAGVKEQLSQKDRSWKAAMQQAVAVAVADSSARDDALRSCLRAELEAAAQQEREKLKRDSSAAVSQQEAESRSQMASLRDEHAAALASLAAEFEAKHAQQARQTAVEAQKDLAANASKLQEAQTAALAQQAQDAAWQLSECKQRYIHTSLDVKHVRLKDSG